MYAVCIFTLQRQIQKLVIALFSAAVFVNLYVNTFPSGPWSIVAKHDCIFYGNQVFFAQGMYQSVHVDFVAIQHEDMFRSLMSST